MSAPKIDRLDVRCCTLPTENGPESDGTAEWSATTMVIVQPRAMGVSGLGYTYSTAAAAVLARDVLAPCVVGLDASAVPQARARMLHAIRNFGRSGVVACAISAVDIALWDLKARLLNLPLAHLLGPARERVPVYASGGFTSTSLDALAREIESYVAAGYLRAKIKIGRDPIADLERVRVLSEAAGGRLELMVDANGAYSRKLALRMLDRLRAGDVTYFEEPVSSDDLDGLRLVRDHASLDVAAGEYGFDSPYFARMLERGAVDILQCDATRALGITGFLDADALCEAAMTPLSAHCAPAIHAHAGAAARRLVHVEHFRDHVRMEARLFDHVPELESGELRYDPRLPGLGIVLRAPDARRLAA